MHMIADRKTSMVVNQALLTLTAVWIILTVCSYLWTDPMPLVINNLGGIHTRAY